MKLGFRLTGLALLLAALALTGCRTAREASSQPWNEPTRDEVRRSWWFKNPSGQEFENTRGNGRYP